MASTVHIHIDTLIVDGLDAGQARMFSSQWQEALGAELRKTGAARFVARPMTVPVLGPVHVAPPTGSHRIQAVDGARAMLAAISGRPARRGR